jgi:O-antigen/teichoic acid export membrane protein
MIAGLISFPIWTRVFSKAEYGLFSLVGVTIALGIGFSKFGLQHAALRFYSDFKEKKTDIDISYYYSTLVIGVILISGTLIFSVIAITKIFFKDHINSTINDLLILMGIIVFIRSVNRILGMFLRAQQRPLLYSVFAVGMRYGNLLFALVVFFYFIKGLKGVLLGWAIADGIRMLFLFSLFADKIKIHFRSSPFLIEAIRYSFPLIWMEMANMILNFGDRYLLQYFMGSAAVGVYSAGYNLSSMAQSFLSSPLRLAVIPIYLSMWNKQGEKETKLFLSNVLKYYFMFGIPIMVGLSWFGGEVITLLATAKYREAQVIIPFILMSLLLYGTYPIFSAGLRIQKKTTSLMYLTFLAGLLNIILNTFFIPKFGLMGAAYATLIAYAFYISPILKYLIISVITVLLVSNISGESIRMFMVKMTAGILIYFSGIFIIEKNIRMKFVSLVYKR